MALTALVMAGGRGVRMNLPVEKPLLEVGEKTLVERVLQALLGSEAVNRIVVATTSHTQETASKVRRTCEIIESPGDGYVPDAKYAIKKLGLGKVIIVSADLPFLESSLIDAVVERFERCGKPALAVVVPLQVCERLGASYDHVIESQSGNLVPIGLNMIDGRQIREEELEQELFIVEEEYVAINVNTQRDLELAEELYARKISGKSKS